jgi:hypothetical protein
MFQRTPRTVTAPQNADEPEDEVERAGPSAEERAAQAA